MGTGTQYKEELVARAETLLESGDPYKEERGAELAHMANRMHQQELSEYAATINTVDHAGVLAAEVETLELEWVWKGWIPKQFVGILVGDSGIGKSSLIRDLTRRLTRGEKLPDGQDCLPCGVVVISYEEPTESVLVPRMRECGVDLSKVRILSKVSVPGKMGEPSERAFRVPEDLGTLARAIEEVDAGVVFIDPLMSMTDKAIARNQTAREILDALQAVAHERGCAIVIVAHLNKGRSTEIRQRMNSSKAFYDMPRFILAAASDISNPKRTTLWMDKHSLCGPVPTLTYEREGGTIRYISGHIDEAKPAVAEEEANRSSNKILAYFAAHEREEVQARTLTNATGIAYDAMRKQLSRMTAQGVIERTERGLYRLSLKKREDVTCPNVTNETQIAPMPMTQEEYVQAVNAPTVPLDIKQLPEDQQTIVLNVLTGKGTR